MIIHRLHAKNVLKYTELKLEDLPSQGLIAISGPNESGKSTIGETLCFALFGRTFSLGYEDLEKVIHWGETHCAVELDFTASDGQRYTLKRFLDDAGNHSARLALTDQAEDVKPLARGVERVADQVYALIGYEYEEFIESFYLAQREITTPHPHSYAIKTMAGLVTLEYCADALNEEREQARNAMEETRREIDGLSRQMQEIDLDPALLPRLREERGELDQRLENFDRQLTALEQGSLAYQEALPKRESARQSRGIASFFGTVFLLLGLLTLGAWLFLTQLPEHDISDMLNDLLVQVIPGWDATMYVWLLFLAGGWLLLSLLFWVWRASRNRQLREYEQTGHELAAILEDLTTGTTSAPSEPAVDAEAPADESEAPGSDSPEEEQRRRLIQRVGHFQADVPEVREGVGREQNRLREAMPEAQERRGRLDEAIKREQNKLGRQEGLSAMQKDLEQKNKQRRHNRELRGLAIDLINGSMRDVSHKFNHKIRGLVGSTLPLFTENRYEYLQIEEDLSVRVFSSEKRDFMDLEEISSGTQRQIMLAVRLALSQELVGRAVRAPQFLFLDEPFAFFDQARTRNALLVLPKLSEQLNQIWIIGQVFPDDLQFDRHIRCSREYQQLPPPETSS